MSIRELIPRIHNLRYVIYIRWLGFEWYIRKIVCHHNSDDRLRSIKYDT